MKSNCIIETIRLYGLLRAAKRQRGRLGPGEEIYVWARPSRARNGVVHVGCGVYCKATDSIRPISFKPDDPVDVPWWRAWTRLRFRGRYRLGDWPSTLAERERCRSV